MFFLNKTISSSYLCNFNELNKNFFVFETENQNQIFGDHVQVGQRR